MGEKEPKWLEAAHNRTGLSKEVLAKMSWREVERLLGIEVKEPPQEIKNLLRGGFFAKTKRWVTQEEISSLRNEVDKIVKKYGSNP